MDLDERGTRAGREVGLVCIRPVITRQARKKIGSHGRKKNDDWTGGTLSRFIKSSALVEPVVTVAFVPSTIISAFN